MKNIPTMIIALFVLASCGQERTKNIEVELASEPEAQENIEYSYDLDESSDNVEFNTKSFANASSSNYMAVNNSAQERTEDPVQPVYEKKLIRTARIGIELEDYQKGKATIMTILHKHGAQVTDESESNSYAQLSNNLTIRIPSESFDALMNDFGPSLGHYEYKQISSKDVGEEFYDLKARIKTKKAVMDHYSSFISKAKNIEELLQIEHEIRKLREEIEAKEGRLKYLSSRVSFSTIHLKIYQNLDFDRPNKKRPGFGNKMLTALKSGWTSILRLVINLTYGWPYLLFFGFGLYFAYVKVIKPRIGK